MIRCQFLSGYFPSKNQIRREGSTNHRLGPGNPPHAALNPMRKAQDGYTIQLLVCALPL
jgi:hypothetical protein